MSTFFFSHFWTILGTLGGLGGIGTVVLLAVLGIPAAAVIASVLGFGRQVIAFFCTTQGAVVGVIGLCVFCLLIGDVHGHRKELIRSDAKITALNAQWQKREKDAADKFADERRKRDSNVASDVETLVQSRLADIAAQTAASQQTVHPDDNAPDRKNCVLSPADLDDGLRGQTARPIGSTVPRSTRHR